MWRQACKQQGRLPGPEVSCQGSAVFAPAAAGVGAAGVSPEVVWAGEAKSLLLLQTWVFHAAGRRKQPPYQRS
eukprot:8577362-Lingulodinium_polyedra.AAC.1